MLDALHEEGGILETLALGLPGATHQAVGARIDGDRESIRLGSRAKDDVATVPGPHVHDYGAEPGGYRSDLTDVDVDEALAEKSTHVGMLTPREPAAGRRCMGGESQARRRC
jgi:hypothetical protein